MDSLDILTKEQRQLIRRDILNFEEQIKKMPGAVIGDNALTPLKHTYTDGIYTREIFIPAGMFIVGKLHKHAHPNFLMEGIVMVVTEFGEEIIEAPKAMVSMAGTKRALYAITDLVWITVHHNPSNTQDLEKLEDLVIAKNYDEYEKFVQKKLPWYNKLLNLIK